MAKAIPKTPKSKTTRSRQKPAGTANVWTIKGVDNETRAKTKQAAKKRGETIGGYVNRVLLEASTADLTSKKSNTAVSITNDEMLERLLQAQSELTAKVDNLVENQNKSLIKKVFG